MADTGVLVDSGTFKVDRKQALEKLKDFQLPDPTKFLLPWVRCAVASGATGIQFKTDGALLQMQFNGRPLSRRDLDGVYDYLFESATADSARNRFLATGLLSALRLAPGEVRIISGKAPERHRLCVVSLGQETVEQADDPSTATVLQVEWRGLQGHLPHAALSHLEEHYGMGPIPIEIEGEKKLPPHRDALRRTDEGLSLWFNEEGVRGFIWVPEGLSYEESTVRLHTYGVLAQPIGVQFPVACVGGSINDDLLTLNVSQSGVVRNERFERTVRLVEAQAERLLLQILGSRWANLATAGECFEDLLWCRCWQDALGGSCDVYGYKQWGDEGFDYTEWTGDRRGSLPALTASIRRRFDEESAATFRRMAYVVPWLRYVCDRSRNELRADSPNPMLKKLLQVPLFMSVAGKPMSLADLDALRASFGHIPYSYAPDMAQERPLPFEVVWCDSMGARDLLLRRFPHSCNDVRRELALLMQESGFRRHGSAGKTRIAYLEAAGVLTLLIRDEFRAGSFQGEVGLPVSPLEGGGRLHVIRNGASAGYIPLECGLRFVAAVNDPDSRKGASGPALLQDPDLRAVKAAAMEAARGLYRKVAPEYGGQVRTPRNDAICAHLLDYLLLAVGGGAPLAPVPEPDRWIESVMLFHTLEGWWSYARLREAFQEGRAIGIIPSLLVTEPLLSRLLPGAGFLAAPGKPGVRVLFKKAPKSSCGHFAMEGDVNALLDRLIALVGENGTFLDAPGDPSRRFLLQAVGRVLAPWPDHAKTPRYRTLLDLLEHLPMFRRPDGTGWTVTDLGERLVAGAKLHYVSADHPQPDARADLVLTEEELDLVKRFWPSRKDRLVPFVPASSLRSALPKKMLSPAPVPAKPITKQAVPKAPAPLSIMRPRPAATQRPAAPPPPRAHPTPAPASKKPGVVDLGRQILTELRGRRGVKLLSGMASLRLRPFSGGSLLDIGRAGTWSLNASHSMTQAVLGAPLPDSEKAAYLASLVYTAANRSLSYVTDQDDEKFQQALADHVTERRDG